MHEKNSAFLTKQCSMLSTADVSESGHPFDKCSDCGMSSLWNGIVLGLERSVEDELLSDDSKVVSKALRSLRQFVVGSQMNKNVVSNSTVIRPRLLKLLCKFRWWSLSQTNVCIDICGLINSLVRDCFSLSEHILSHSDALNQLVQVALDPATNSDVREACSLLLRSLFGAESLSSVLSQATPVHSRRTAALQVFTDENLLTLLGFFKSVDTSCSQLVPSLTKTASDYLMQLLAVLSTDPDMATRLHRLNAVQVCHTVIMKTACDHRNRCFFSTSCDINAHPSHWISRGRCVNAIDPASHLLARFALKLMVHILFHVEDALETFQQAYQSENPLDLVGCYGHFLGSAPPNSSSTSHRMLPGCRSKWSRKCHISDSQCIQSSGSSGLTLGPSLLPSKLADTCSHTNHVNDAVSTCAPSSHGTQALVGLLRGVICWRLVTRKGTHVVDAVDQFGTPVTSTIGLDLTSDDVTLLVIQPLTDSCLHAEDIRILSWICHVLVLVLDDRPELHICTVYTNSFIREIDGRVTSLINAVQETSNSHNHVQFIEHLIPLVKLFACLASTCESIRILFAEATMCSKLIDFALRLKPLGLEHTVLFLDFQHSIAVLLHVLSRSFGAHHSFFRHQDTTNRLMDLIEENLLPACRGRSVCAGLVEAASGALVNIILPMSPARESSPTLFSRCVSLFIRLIKISEQPLTSTSSIGFEQTDCSLPELTSDLRSRCILNADKLTHTLNVFRLNGIWGLANLLHSATASSCTDVFDHLISEGAWLELVRPVPLTCHSNPPSSWPKTTDTQYHPVQSVQSCSCEHEKSVSLSEDPSVKQSVPLISLPSPDAKMSSGLTAPAETSEPSSSLFPLVTQQSTVRQRFNSRGHTESDSYSIQATITYYTLSLIRNLLRHRKVIDTVVKDHWWNIAQLLISVLEGGHPQPVKEQAILVLAHIANGQTALEQLRLNQDLIEKLKLFMRSPDSYTKAAALVATFHVLGLGRENLDAPLLLGSRKDPVEPFFVSFHRRLRHRHNCHRDRYKHRYETQPSIPGASSTSETHRRHLLSSVNQSLLEESGEHEEEEQNEEKHDIDIGYTSTSLPFFESSPENSRSSMPQVCLAPFNEEGQSSAPPQFCHDQGTSLSASPVSDTLESSQTQVDNAAASPLQLRGSHRSLSTGSTSSSGSSASCGEQFIATGMDLADLDQSTTQDLFGSSPPTESETELKVLSMTANEDIQEISEFSQCSSAQAPLAAQERMDEFDSSLVSSVFCHQGHGDNEPTGLCVDNTNPTNETDISVCVSLSSETTSTTTQMPTNLNSARSRRSRRDWEIGFHQVLFPFLRELESDAVLRSTWDWLMLRAFTRGKPIQLHDLFVAWQRLYDTIPPDSFIHTDPESLCLDSSLFTDCPSIAVFLQRLRDSISGSTSSVTRMTNASRSECPSSRRRHHHHHRHRHRLSTYPRHSPVHPNEISTVARGDTPLPPSLSDSEPVYEPSGSEQNPSGAPN